jgi:pimeloyl-ACP methyl ester carboxylesterase
MNDSNRQRLRLVETSPIGWLAGLAVLAVFLSNPVPAHSRQSPAWKDPSPHVIRFVNVTADVRLEVLDWHGSGRAIVLLAGGGETAHVFDDFAPKLAATFHVYGITRRGFGASGFSEAEKSSDPSIHDVIAVFDALKLQKPVLVGHSIAGAELSGVANTHQSRIAGLIYLDAAYPYAFDNGHVPSFDAFQSLNAPQPPAPAKPDLANFAALRQYYLRVLGFTYPEAELRQRFAADPDGSVGPQRAYPGYATLLVDLKKYAAIPSPALLLFAHPHSVGTWVDNATDPTVRQAATTYRDALAALTVRQMKALTDAVPSARIVAVPQADHHLYLSNETEVLREMRSFLNGLR